jgi:hypothetical protein
VASIRGIQLNSQPDQIQWRFAADGQYSSRSAYRMQFKVSIQDYSWDKVWKIKVKNKCKFFLWLLLQRKLLTTDQIIKRGGQANPVCQICRTRNESMTHMVANCYCSKRVWQLIEQQTHQQNTHPQQPVSNLKSWWSDLVGTVSLDPEYRNQIITYTTWNIWKERCRRVYDNKALTETQLTALIRQEVAAFRQATETTSSS